VVVKEYRKKKRKRPYSFADKQQLSTLPSSAPLLGESVHTLAGPKEGPRAHLVAQKKS